MNFPFLSIIIFSPIVGAVVELLLPDEGKLNPEKDGQRIEAIRTTTRVVAATTTFISLALGLYVFFGVNHAYNAGAVLL